ncbi:hypothetical protein ATI61_11620 [Archangium gephyra]|uniref:Uncharacterized protein n=1 Tax=Archangium gephyra TaxID=48 RepID=A0AAC8QAI2_9BACT|nr:hypothetical protein [Archangium gephyra]AKJ03770.1 Hypothetical protein AA314_05396 [Archangium gephyra]REG23552.1 hypothetical protein ATI61_11620 [Archangium gephyra]
MSYLNPLRLHFAGRFQASISTVNNDPGHFDNSTFQASYQQMEGINMNPPNGWFNPQGDAAWRFLNCKVTSAWTKSGQVTRKDPVLACLIADSDSKPPAKLVDLDPEQQLVSEIWGLQVRIADSKGKTLMRGDFEPAAFTDIWDRAKVSTGGDADACAVYQSVLRNLHWADDLGSKFLSELKKHADREGLLSIKFNVDGFNMDYTSPEFMTGRITGTIGPASASEPRHLVIGRHFMAGNSTGGNFYTPPGNINYCAAVVDEKSGNLYLDLGNALPTGAGGSIMSLGDLTLSANSTAPAKNKPGGTQVTIGVIPSGGKGGYASDPQWYDKTAGIVVLPIPKKLLKLVQTSQLVLRGSGTTVISEWSSGAYVRADTFVYRMSPGDTVEIPLYAMQYGKPLAGTALSFGFDPSQLQAQVGSGFPFVTTSPPVATTPDKVLKFDTTSVVTDSNGRATLKLTASDPGTPRNFNISASNPKGDYGIDGQVYGIRPAFADTQLSGNQPVNQWDFISFLVWSGFSPKVKDAPTWYDDLQPIFQQYANLYPVMNRFLNLADYQSVKENSFLLNLAFGLDASNPNSMPVTRDLSPAKRTAILQWLKNGVPLGTAPTKAAAKAAAKSHEAKPAPTPPATATPAVMKRGGKVFAASRRLVVQNRKESGQ